MSGKVAGSTRKGETAEQRRERLAGELRSNLQKRKALARVKARRDVAQDENAATLALPGSREEH